MIALSEYLLIHRGRPAFECSARPALAEVFHRCGGPPPHGAQEDSNSLPEFGGA